MARICSSIIGERSSFMPGVDMLVRWSPPEDGECRLSEGYHCGLAGTTARAVGGLPQATVTRKCSRSGSEDTPGTLVLPY